MPRVPEETIDQIRQSVDIVDIISEHVMLDKRGKNFLGLCPFHDDSKPSFNVSQDKQIYKCFACGAGGNVFTFLQNFENISFIEALRQLADRAGIPLPTSNPEARDQQEAYDLLYKANELALKYFHHMLLEDESGASALTYLKNRGLSEDTIQAFSLGYAPDSWDGFLKVATRRGLDPPTLERAGLVSPRQNGNGFYDRFRNRVMFPIQAHTGRTVAFGARALDPDEQAKYLNSPETPIYNKSNILFGLYQGRDAIRSSETALVVEGYMDLIALFQRDIKNVVASSGTALTTQHGRLLRRYADKTTLVFDGDAAGTSAAVRGIGALFESDLEIKVVSLPENHDPDSYVTAHGPEGFQALLQSASPVVDFLISWVSSQEDLTTSDGKARAVSTLAEPIARIGNQTLKHLLVKETAEKLAIDERTLLQIVGKTVRPRSAKTQQPQPPPETFDPRPRLERELLIQMMTDSGVADQVLAQLTAEEFSNSVYRQIVALMAQNRSTGKDTQVAPLIDQCQDPNLAGIISTLSMEVGLTNPEQADVPLADYIQNFRLKSLDNQITHLESCLRTASKNDLKPLMEKHRTLTGQRKALVEDTASQDSGPLSTPVPEEQPF